MITFQEEVNISQAHLNKKENNSSYAKILTKYEGTIELETEAEYLDADGNLILNGKIKKIEELGNDPNTNIKIYELTIFDKGYNLKERNINEVYRDELIEDIIQDIVEKSGLVFENQLGSSGITIEKKTYRDLDPIEVINELLGVLGASWRVFDDTFYMYKRGQFISDLTIDETQKWKTDGWTDDTDKKVDKLIVKGAIINQRTTETLTGTDTIFYTSRIPEDVYIENLVQTTSNIEGDYKVDKQNKKITFNDEQTDPVVSYSYKSELRVEVGNGDIVRELKKSYIEDKTEARKLGRKYLEVYKDGVSNAEFETNQLYLDINKFNVGDRILVYNKLNTDRNGEYIITQVDRQYPKTLKIKVGEDTLSIYDWQSESKERLKQLERTDDNFDFITLDEYLIGNMKVKINSQITKLFSVKDDGRVLFASEDPLDSLGDMIYDMSDGYISGATYTTGIVGDYALSFDNVDVENKVSIPNSSALWESGDLTVSLWIKPINILVNQYILCHYNWRFYFTTSNKINFGVGRMNSATGPQYNTISLNGLSNGDIHHLVGIYHPDPIGGNGYVKLYVDGILQQTTSIGSDIIWTGYGGEHNLQWGNSGHGVAIPYEGIIDETIIYTNILSQEEITTLFNKGVIYDGLVAKYSFEEGSGNVARINCPIAYDDDAEFPEGTYQDYLS